MMKHPFLTLALLTEAVLSGYGAEPLFHFTFSKTLKQQNVKDQSGKFTLESPQKLFLFERGGLRIAEGAQFHVPAEQLPVLKDQFTLTTWFHAGARGLDNTLFFRGLRPDKPQIRCQVQNLSPSLSCETVNGTCGIYTSGYGHMIVYPDKSVIVDAKAAEVQNGTWNMVRCVICQGPDVKFHEKIFSQ